MAKFNEKQVSEINEVIEAVNKGLKAINKPKVQIGAKDRATLSTLLKANKVEPTTITFFPCKREYSDSIVSYFVNEKGLVRNRFSGSAQSHIFILLQK